MTHAQELFYTDSYLSNFYHEVEEKFVFHNNTFLLLDASTKEEVHQLMFNFFEENGIQSTLIESTDKVFFSFTYKSPKFNGIAWSKSWHQNFESRLNSILNDYLADYFNQSIPIPESIQHAATIKLAYYNWLNYKHRSSDFSTTRINISANGIDTKAFTAEFISPNLSFGRIVSNSFQNLYNESYPIINLDSSIRFVFGPTSKARLIDCISMHIHAGIHGIQSPIYLSKQSLILVPEERIEVNEQLWDVMVSSAIMAIVANANDLHQSYYTIDDVDRLSELAEVYNKADYLDFERIYFEENSFNLGHPIELAATCFNKSILDSKVNFKDNSTLFLHEMDSLVLNVLGQFLTHNKKVNLLLIGYQEKGEYTKIDRDKFKALVGKYSDYPPVKSSKRVNLAIFRSVIVFDYLVQVGIDPKRISCLSSKVKNEEEKSNKVDWTFR